MRRIFHGVWARQKSDASTPLQHSPSVMSDLKRKREDDDGEGEENVEIPGRTPSCPLVAPPVAEALAPSTEPPTQTSAGTTKGDGKIGNCNREGSTTDIQSNTGALPPSTATLSAEGAAVNPFTTMICGEEISLTDTAGRRKKKRSREMLVFLAYQAQLAITCQDNNMMAALEIYREMKSKGIRQDVSVS